MLRACWSVVFAALPLLAAAPVRAQAANRPAAVTRAETQVQNDVQAVSAAQTALDNANKALSNGIEKRGRDFEKSPDLKTAQKTLADAGAALDAARAAALDHLKDTDAYAEAIAKLTAAKSRLAQSSSRGPAATDASAARDEVDRIDAIINALEESAIQNDADMQAARAKLAAAMAAVKGLKDKYAADGSNDPELTTLRKARDDAKDALTNAVTRLESDRDKLTAAQNAGGRAGG